LQEFCNVCYGSGSTVAINIKDYLRIKEAAALLGVSEGTLRNWGRQQKIPTHRHPINGYRLFRKEDLDTLLSALHKSAKPPSGKAKQTAT
jgi:excisionase family DNA binding protein